MFHPYYQPNKRLKYLGQKAFAPFLISLPSYGDSLKLTSDTIALNRIHVNSMRKRIALFSKSSGNKEINSFEELPFYS
jgi:hypothetical protein